MGDLSESSEGKNWYDTLIWKTITAVLSIVGAVLGLVNFFSPPEYVLIMNNTLNWKKGDSVFFVTNEGKRAGEDLEKIETKFIMALTDGGFEILKYFPVYDLDNSIKKTGKTVDLIQYTVYEGEEKQFSHEGFNLAEFGADFIEDIQMKSDLGAVEEKDVEEKVQSVIAMELIAVTRIGENYYFSTSSDYKKINEFETIELQMARELFDGEDSTLQKSEVPMLYKSDNKKSFFKRSYDYFIEEMRFKKPTTK